MNRKIVVFRYSWDRYRTIIVLQARGRETHSLVRVMEFFCDKAKKIIISRYPWTEISYDLRASHIRIARFWCLIHTVAKLTPSPEKWNISEINILKNCPSHVQ